MSPGRPLGRVRKLVYAAFVGGVLLAGSAEPVARALGAKERRLDLLAACSHEHAELGEIPGGACDALPSYQRRALLQRALPIRWLPGLEFVPNVHKHFDVNAASFNEIGLRDDFALDDVRVPGEVRIALLGDSMAFGLRNGQTGGVDYPALLEERLRERLGRPVSVDNWAYPTLNATQALAIARFRALPAREPDALVFAFFANDTETNSYWVRSLGSDPGSRYEVVFELPDPSLHEREPTAWDRVSFALRTRSFALTRLGFAAESFRHFTWGPLVHGPADAIEVFAPISYTDALLAMERLADLAEARGLPFAVFVNPSIEASACDALGPDSVLAGHAVVDMLRARRPGVPVLAPTLEELEAADPCGLVIGHTLPDDAFFDYHYSPAGHEVMARVLDRELERLGWFASAP